MSQQFCPECGHENPVAARYCMECGSSVDRPDAQVRGHRTGQRALRRPVAESPAPDPQPGGQGTDWAAIATAILAFLSLRRLSRGARNATIVTAFLVLFFGCPMVCGFVMYVMEWIARLFG
jgi:ribosomal protein L40E